MSQSLPELPAMRERRERTISALCEHFAQDRISLDEFESRLDLAHKALQPADLDVLVADIQVPASTPVPAPRQVTSATPASDETKFIVGVMGGAERRGTWRPAANNVVLGLMGGCVLDFREAQLGPGVTDVFVFCCMGGAEIIVPPDLAVESNGFALMGGFEHGEGGVTPEPGQPVIRVHGFALMGGVDISVRLPGESARDAKRRRKEQRRLGRSNRGE